MYIDTAIAVMQTACNGQILLARPVFSCMLQLLLCFRRYLRPVDSHGSQQSRGGKETDTARAESARLFCTFNSPGGYGSFPEGVFRYLDGPRCTLFEFMLSLSR